MWLGSIVALAPFGVARPEQFWWMAGPYMGHNACHKSLVPQGNLGGINMAFLRDRRGGSYVNLSLTPFSTTTKCFVERVLP